MTRTISKSRDLKTRHSNPRTLLTSAFVGLVALGTTALPSFAEGPAVDLLTTVGGWETADKLGSSAAVEGLAVEVRSDLLTRGADRIRFQDFDGRAYEAELDRVERALPGAATWIGTVSEFGEHSQVLLTSYEGAVSGYLDTPEARYEIVPRPGSHVMVKLDPSRFASCGTEDGEHDHDDPRGRYEAAATLGIDPAKLDSQVGAASEAGDKSSVAQIDIAVLYSQTTKNEVGGESAIVSTIVSAIATLNTAFSASDIDAFANLVGTQEASTLGDSSGGEGGLVLAFFGNGSGLSNSNEEELFENHPGIGGQSEAGDAFGEVLARGDFDGDGYDDLAVGVPGEDLSSGSIVDTGLVWALYGSADGISTLGDRKFHQNSGLADSNEDGDQFGYSLASGDFDGDGYEDLAIGVPFETLGSATGTGRVQILYGTSSGLQASGSQSIDQGQLGGVSNQGGDNFGWALTSGDFDGDGYADLAIGIPGEDSKKKQGFLKIPIFDSGRVTVVFGSSSGLDPGDSQNFDQNSSGVGNSRENHDRFGQALAAGDFDNDGRDDLVIGVPREDLGGLTDTGMIHVLFGTSAGLTGSGSQTFDQDGLSDARESGDRLGTSFGVGDFDGDGIDDLAVGAPYENTGSADVGRVNLLYGGGSGLTNAGFSITGNQAGALLGDGLAAADFDGDGRDDLAVGSPSYDVDSDGTNAGRVQVFEGTATGFAAGDVWSQDAGGVLGVSEDDDFLGTAVVTGDFDGDGDLDLVVGVPGEGVSNDSSYFKKWLGASSQVSSLRASTGADLVGLIVEKLAGYCGSAQTVLNSTNGDSSKFYQVTDRGCAVGNLTFAHEVGHLIGLAHDPANAGGSGACDDANGHYVSGEGRTLMSYSNQCSGGCSRVALISDPDIDFSFGDPSGIAGERDNARCARLSVPNVAAYN